MSGAMVAGQVLGLLVNLVLINLWEETAFGSGPDSARAPVPPGQGGDAHGRAVRPRAHAAAFIGNFTGGSLITALITLLIVCALDRLMIGVFLDEEPADSILPVAVLHSVFNRSNTEEGMIAALVDGEGRKLAGLVAAVVPTGPRQVNRRRPDPSDSRVRRRQG